MTVAVASDTRVVTGNHAVSYGALLARVQVISAYPITPQTQVVELLSKFCEDGTLDAKFREVMRTELKRLHIDIGATTVYVTHDQVEAMSMGDRIAVMSEGELQQVGAPGEVYDNPANLFVANFIGSPGMNFMDVVCGQAGQNTNVELRSDKQICFTFSKNI